MIAADKDALKWFIGEGDLVEWKANADGSVKITDGAFEIKGVKEGETVLEVRAIYRQNGKEYTAAVLLPVTVAPPAAPGGEG